MNSRESNYSVFAPFYDRLMEEYDYEKVAEFLGEVVAEEAPPLKHIIEMACGTGNLTGHLARWATVEAFDLSQEMLSIAYGRHYRNKRIQLYAGDMRDFTPRKKGELVLCLCDSLNYLKNLDEMKDTFSSVHASLVPGGVFLFDLNTPFHFKEYFGEEIEVEEGENYYFTWQNHYEEEMGENHYLLNFFLEEENGLYRRFVEEHMEYTYALDEIKDALESQNFRLLSIYNGYEKDIDVEKAKRWVFVAKREEA